jgi:hypothetical protein
MATETARQEFLDSLPIRPQELGDRDRAFVRALLQFGSETDDNKQCVDRIGLQRINHPDGTARVGFALRHSGIPVADVFNAAEGSPLPALLAETFPDVTQDDWDAVLRLATLIFAACESPLDPT